MEETNQVKHLQQELATLKNSHDELKSETAREISGLKDKLATKDEEIRNLRTAVDELKQNYAVEEAENDSPEEEDNDESTD